MPAASTPDLIYSRRQRRAYINKESPRRRREAEARRAQAPAADAPDISSITPGRARRAAHLRDEGRTSVAGALYEVDANLNATLRARRTLNGTRGGTVEPT